MYYQSCTKPAENVLASKTLSGTTTATHKSTLPSIFRTFGHLIGPCIYLVCQWHEQDTIRAFNLTNVKMLIA